MNMQTRKTGVSFLDVSIDRGFWHNRQIINSKTTIYAVWEQFQQTGRFDSLNHNWREGEPQKPHIFWDSDVAKWVESVAYIIAKNPDPVLELAVDKVIDLVEKHQDKNGYFNTYFTVVEPDQHFSKRAAHELYCAGHLIEAAVAYYTSTGKDKFLKLVRKYADYIEKVFKIDQSAAYVTCGHPEIELALIKLYHVTAEKRYLELSRFFVENRGRHAEIPPGPVNDRYAQDHLPVREQNTAEGHAVRLTYLYCAAVDLALEYDDKELMEACRRVFNNIITRRMYITGSIGSSAAGEAFTIDYDLPNLTAYAESCAAIGLAQFSRRMLLTDTDSVYADTTERIFYNGFLASISLDGKAFFYENPLEIHPELVNRDVSVTTDFPERQRLAVTQRQAVFSCSCCPPNISRFIATLGDFLYTSDKNTLFVHHYISSETKTHLNGIAMKIVQKTDYPKEGKITVKIKGAGVCRAAFRIPYWCARYSFKINGQPAEYTLKKGYAYILLASGKVNTIDIVFEMATLLIEASPEVQEDSGRVVVQRGPVIYCLEAIDNGSLLRDIRIAPGSFYQAVSNNEFGIPEVRTRGYRRKKTGHTSALYRPASGRLERVDLKFIPYFAFANRGESEMIVWVLKK
jgi:uncharacterized protein